MSTKKTPPPPPLDPVAPAQDDASTGAPGDGSTFEEVHAPWPASEPPPGSVPLDTGDLVRNESSDSHSVRIPISEHLRLLNVDRRHRDLLRKLDEVLLILRSMVE